MGLEHLDIHILKNVPWPVPHTLYKYELKWTRSLEFKCKTITLKRKKKENFCDLWLDQRFLDVLYITPKAHTFKEKIGKLELTKIKNFCSIKNTVKAMKSHIKYLQNWYLIKDLYP